MSHSFSQTAPVTCPRCNRSFEAEVWLIVDAAERPDLLAKAREGKLHEIVCPQCGPIAQADAPLLLYLASPLEGLEEEVRVLFSPAQHTSAEQDRAQADDLVRRLKESFGPAWREPWSERIALIPRPLLSLALSEGMQAVQREIENQMSPELRAVLEELARRGVKIRSAEDLERALEEHPDLRAKLEAPIARSPAASALERRFQELLAWQTQAQNQPTLWPQVLEGWQSLIAEAEKQGETLLSANGRGNLGEAYRRLYEISGDPAWAERAEGLFRELLQVFTRQEAPQAWATVQHSLGNLFLSRFERSGKQADALKAEEHFRNALEVRPRERAPSDWAMTQHSLGNLFLSRFERSGEQADARAAEEHFRNALEVRPRERAPSDWAMTQHSLGNLFLRRFERSGEQADALKAERRYGLVLGLAKKGTLPAVYPFRAAAALTRLHFRRQNWSACRETAAEAFSHLEELLIAGLTPHSKAAWLGEARGISALAARAWLQAADPCQAVLALERGRAYLLREAMGLFDRDLERLPALGFQTLYERFVSARSEVQRLSHLLEGESVLQHLEPLKAARAELIAAAEAIRQEVGERQGDAYPEYRFFMEPLPFEAIQAQAQDAPLVYLAAPPSIGEQGGFALIVRQGEAVQVVELPLTEDTLREQLFGPGNDPRLGGYLGAYLRWQKAEAERKPAPERQASLAAWMNALQEALDWLGQEVMGPLVECLEALGVPKNSVVRLVAGGWLGLLPLHAARLPSAGAGEQPPLGGYALDHYAFTYVPSAQALYHARRAADRPADSLLAARYPDEKFKYADDAVAVARSFFEDQRCTILTLDNTAKEEVRKAFDRRAVLFFFTHGRADLNEPWQSGLQMTEEDWLTLKEIFRLRIECARLAVLSACESGVSWDFKTTDEVLTLPAGLMRAGVPGVVGTFWSVFEPSTAMLISIFFEEWRANGLTPPQALRRAQQVLRDHKAKQERRSYFRRFLMPREPAYDFQQELYLRDFSHPFFWAAFMYTGL